MKEYLKPGDIVRINKDIPHRPSMVVEKIEKSPMATGVKSSVSGIRCYWFGTDGTLHRHKFDFKDLEQC
jgi:hypothetical protein